VLQLFFLYLDETYNRTLNTIVVKCFKSEPFLLNSFKLTFQPNDNARNLLILYSKCMNKWIPWIFCGPWAKGPWAKKGWKPLF